MRSLAIPLSCLLALVACSRGGGGAPPPVQATSLRAEPTTFAPGDTVLLRPTFADGTGRIDPLVGPVVGGASYRVGPVTTGQRFTLVVTRATGVDTAVVDVPLRYRERVQERPPSPIARTRHGAVGLVDGRVLLVGGASPSPLFWATGEVFDGSGAFAPVGDLSGGRAESAVVALPDGGALTFGGPVNIPSFDLATRIEQWDPVALAWSVRGNMLSNRAGHTATLLDAGRVLVAGGAAVGGAPDERDAELYEPGLGARSPAGEMGQRRAGHTATRLADGRVLLAGGVDPGTGLLLTTTELYDPVTETFAPGPDLLRPRTLHAAVALADGSVLLAGGDDLAGPVATAERFDALATTSTPAGDLREPASFVRAVRLLDGSVLTAGGVVTSGLATDRIEVWEPASNTWRTWQARMPARRTGHSLHARPDGRVLVLGGDAGDGYPLPTCWVLD